MLISLVFFPSFPFILHFIMDSQLILSLLLRVIPYNICCFGVVCVVTLVMPLSLQCVEFYIQVWSYICMDGISVLVYMGGILISGLSFSASFFNVLSFPALIFIRLCQFH